MHEEIKNAIEYRIKNKGKIMITVHFGKFTHPASNSDISLIDLLQENIKDSYRIE